MKAKKTLRSRTQYPALNKSYNLKIRHEVLDQDYIDKLNPAEKDWLNRFNEEYVAANLKHKGKLLHKTKKLKKSIYDANNARNRDIHSIHKSNDTLKGEKEVVNFLDSNHNKHVNDTEDTIIDLIDSTLKKSE